MNLKGRYNMLRTAILAMIGVPDEVEQLKQMAAALQGAASIDADAAASLLVLQTLIVTHDAAIEEKYKLSFLITVNDGDWTGTFEEWQQRRGGQ